MSLVRVAKAAGEGGLETWESQGIGFIIPGGLKGIDKLDDLVTELVAAYVSPASTRGSNKEEERPPFAFFLGAFSALSRRDDIPHDFMQLCEAGRDEAVELAAAAAFYADAEMLEEMQRGIEAVNDVENRHYILSRHVVAIRQAFRKIVAEGNTKPHKGKLRREAISILNAQGFTPHHEKSHDRWREVYQAAGLSDLPQERAKRRKSRNHDW